MASTFSPARLGAALLGAVLAAAVACASFSADEAASPAVGVFWTDLGAGGGDGSIFTCQPDPDPDTCMTSLRVVARVRNLRALAVDAVSVYSSTLGDADGGAPGEVLRVAKP